MSHGGTTSLPGELWRERRLARPIREDVPIESDETNIQKANRTHDGFRVLREKVAEINPDVLVVFGDDQLECFDFNNYPAFAVYVGDEFQNSRRGGGGGEGGGGGGGGEGRQRPPQVGRHAPSGTTFKGHKELATEILVGLMRRDFDPAFCMDAPKPERGGLGHAFVRPAEEITDMTVPIVPILMNVYYAPQPTGMRCYQLGRAIRDIIDKMPGDLRVGVVGSGGLWHTPGTKGAWLNTEFDLRNLELLKAGDIRGMAEHFDSYVIPEDDTSQDFLKSGHGITGMPMVAHGPQFGTRETCAWISAAAVADGSTTTIVDYIDAYASPVGNAFAYCDNIAY
jgi:hypothetical protein